MIAQQLKDFITENGLKRELHALPSRVLNVKGGDYFISNTRVGKKNIVRIDYAPLDKNIVCMFKLFYAN